MSEHKVIWFGNDEPEPTAFFSRSLFRSWKFWMNTVLLGTATAELLVIAWKSDSVFSMPLYALFATSAVFPYIVAFKRHQRIQERYLSGQLDSSPADPVLRDVLQIADDAINEGLRNSIFAFGLVLLAILKWKLHAF